MDGWMDGLINVVIISTYLYVLCIYLIYNTSIAYLVDMWMDGWMDLINGCIVWCIISRNNFFLIDMKDVWID